MHKTIEITRLSHSKENGAHRVSAEVNGSPCWFESQDTNIYASPEALASAFLVIAMENKADLTINAPLNAQWLANSKFLMTIFRKWWKYPEIRIYSNGTTTGSLPRGGKTALCFTGGVDSFYTFLRGPHTFDELVFIHGYDIPVAETSIMKKYHQQLQGLSQLLKVKISIIRSNLRDHPLYCHGAWSKTKGWLRYHGGALAAIGHLMSDIGSLVISSSYPIVYNHPWGSHWKTDPLWGSQGLEIIHEGAELWRMEKLKKLVNESLVQKYLRVCTNFRRGLLNCCECEKCIRTMLIIQGSKKLKEFTCFEKKHDLLQNLESLKIRSDLFPVYRGLRSGLDLEFQLALDRTLKRSFREEILNDTWMGKIIQKLWQVLPEFIRRPIKQILKT